MNKQNEKARFVQEEESLLSHYSIFQTIKNYVKNAWYDKQSYF